MDLKLHIDVQEFDAVGITYPNDTLDQLIAHEMTHAIMGVTTNYVSLENWFREGTTELIPGGDGRLAAVMDGTLDTQTSAQVAANIDNLRGGFGGSHLDYATAYAATRYLHAAIGGNGMKDMLSYLAADTSRTMDDYFTTGAVAGIADTDAFVSDFKTNGEAFIDAMDLANDDTGGIGGADADGGTRDTTASGTIPDTPGDGANPLAGFEEVWPDLTPPVALGTNQTLEFQVGARASQTLSVNSRHISAATLGIEAVSLVTAPDRAIDIFSEAIDALSAVRAEFGAALSRFESAIRANQIAAESLSAGRSRIMDADFAIETARLTRGQILQRASNAMIAQANSQPRIVLSLLQRL